MTHGFPPFPPPTDVAARMQQLDPLAADNISDQHVVSQVLQRRFTEPCGPKKELFLARLNRRHPKGKLRLGSPAQFGKYEDFVKFASRSVEEVWGRTENRMHATLDAVEQGAAIGDPAHEDVLREAIILHYVRSIPAVRIHADSYDKVREQLGQTTLPDYAFYARYKLYPAGPEARKLILDEMTQPTARRYEQGAIFRANIEDRFKRFTQGASGYAVRIVTATAGEFLFGDTPALAIHWRDGRAATGSDIGLLNADEVVLPVTPKHLAVLRQQPWQTQASADEVDEYNRAQIREAHQYVHFRAGSGLEQYVRTALT